MHREKEWRETYQVSKWGIMGEFFWMFTKVMHMLYKNLDNGERYHIDWLTGFSSHPPPTVPTAAALEKLELHPPDCLQPGMQQIRSSQLDVLCKIWKVEARHRPPPRSLSVDMRFLCGSLPVPKMPGGVSGLAQSPN